jgi:hypothetical protein
MATSPDHSKHGGCEVGPMAGAGLNSSVSECFNSIMIHSICATRSVSHSQACELPKAHVQRN